jgi:hypothetical protein
MITGLFCLETDGARTEREMRAMTMIAFALFACATAAGCSGIQTLDTSTLKTVSLAELPQIAAQAEGDAAKGPGPMIVHVKAGEKVPLHLSLDLPFAELAAGENAIVFKRDVYLYITPDTAMLGFDGTTFARIGDWKALKKLARVKTGSLQIGFGAGKSDGPKIDVSVGMK